MTAAIYFVYISEKDYSHLVFTIAITIKILSRHIHVHIILLNVQGKETKIHQ